MRLVLAALAGMAVAALAAIIGGDYELSGGSLVLAAAALGFVVAEVVSAIAKRRDLAVAAFVALVCAGAAAWMAWIASSRGVVPLGSARWTAPLAAGIIGALSVWSGSRPGRRARDNDFGGNSRPNGRAISAKDSDAGGSGEGLGDE